MIPWSVWEQLLKGSLCVFRVEGAVSVEEVSDGLFVEDLRVESLGQEIDAGQVLVCTSRLGLLGELLR